jgi:hypothetical protein
MMSFSGICISVSGMKIIIPFNMKETIAGIYLHFASLNKLIPIEKVRA